MIRSNLVVIDLKSFLYYSTAIRLSSTTEEWLMNQGKTVFSQVFSYGAFCPLIDNLCPNSDMNVENGSFEKKILQSQISC